MTRLATPTVMKMAQRGTVVDPLPTSHPFSPGESMLCQHMIAISYSNINKIIAVCQPEIFNYFTNCTGHIDRDGVTLIQRHKPSSERNACNHCFGYSLYMQTMWMNTG